jgi:hypothetical protein
VEEVIDVPVSVQSIFGQEANQAIKVTVFRDDQREQAPYLVLNHGRPAIAAEFANSRIKGARLELPSIQSEYSSLAPLITIEYSSLAPLITYRGHGADVQGHPVVVRLSAIA